VIAVWLCQNLNDSENGLGLKAMIPKYRYWHEEYGMCQIKWMEFTLAKSTYTANPFYLGGITCPDGKIIKEIALNPEFIMKSTGMTDKNGIEIYEKDIVLGLPGKHYIVKWDDIHPRFSCRSVSIVFELIKGDCDDLFEIVGNVYENSDLIED
jgi:hypothetical protein